MKKILTSLFGLILSTTIFAQGWPANYEGVMLQGFYWESYDDSQWTKLESQATELGEFFKLVWIPQSGNCGGKSMGYDDKYWFSNYNSSFGTEAQLRSMISTFKTNGIGTIADVVINHRQNANTWNDFPAEEYNGVTYQLTYNDICSDDEAAAAGYAVGTNEDTGDKWDGMRDLDHKSENVQNNVKAYLDMLLNDLGYAGFRYDMVKGYGAEYTKMYNKSSGTQYSVGEYWDTNKSSVTGWIDATGKTSAAFDFPLQYTLRSICNNGESGNWYSLNYTGLSVDNDYKRYSVSFVNNHDTWGRNDTSNELNKYNLAANAYILACPGTPCVFLPDWQNYKSTIKQLIYARNLARIHNQSTTEILQGSARSNPKSHVRKVTGLDGHSVLIVMGSLTYSTGLGNYFKIAGSTTDRYIYYVSKDVESAWTDTPSGTYDGTISVKLNAISQTSGAKLVYTTDGSDPTASSTQVADGTSINISESTTLKVGLLIGSNVTGIITRNYTITDFVAHDINIYVNVDKVGWSTVNFHTWGGNHTGTTWPGTTITATKTINGKTWYYAPYSMSSSTDFINIVVNSGNKQPQTVDFNYITKDIYLEVSTDTDDAGHHYFNDVTDEITGISNVMMDYEQNSQKDHAVYDLMGRKVADNYQLSIINCQLPKGIYIHNGKKIAVK